MPLTKWLVSHCKERVVISATTKPVLHTRLLLSHSTCAFEVCRLIKNIRAKRPS